MALRLSEGLCKLNRSANHSGLVVPLQLGPCRRRSGLHTAAAGSNRDEANSTSSSSRESDTEDEQSAKAVVMELLAHPEEVARKLRKAAVAPGTPKSGKRPSPSLSVNLEWIKALVDAATHGDIGTREHQQQQQQQQRQREQVEHAGGSSSGDLKGGGGSNQAGDGSREGSAQQ